MSFVVTLNSMPLINCNVDLLEFGLYFLMQCAKFSNLDLVDSLIWLKTHFENNALIVK